MKRFALAVFLALAFTASTMADLFDDPNEAIRESLRSKKNLVLVVSAKWCLPCQQLKRAIKKLDEAGAFKDVNVAIVDYESELGRKIYQNKGVPQSTRYSFEEGKWFRQHKLGFMGSDKFLEFANGTKD